jgi:hypothetical protein
METPKEYYYTYYSYEEWGRGYFGSRGCKCLPEEDVKYFGSSKDKTFKPTQKIILKDDYPTREEAYADEIILQEHYKVIENPHFANRAYQTTTGFTTNGMLVTEEFRIKMSSVTKGEKNGMYGKKRPDLAERNRKGRGRKVKYSKNGLKSMKKLANKINSQRWECCETGYQSTAAGVVAYQKGKGITPSKNNRRRIS